MKDLEKDLTKFGLTKKEARIYLALLEAGPAVVSLIAKKTKLNRSTTYVLLDSLAKKGLVNISERQNTKFYNALPPERIVQIIEEQLQKDSELVSYARSILPDLKALRIEEGRKPNVMFYEVRYYEGARGIESVYEDTLTSSEPIRAYANIDNMHETLPHYFPGYYKRRAAKGIHIKSIHPDTPQSRERVMHDHEEERTSALVPKKIFDFSPEINIYDNKIAFMTLKEKFGLIIESPELAEALKRVFDLSWEEARRQDQILRKKIKKRPQ